MARTSTNGDAEDVLRALMKIDIGGSKEYQHPSMIEEWHDDMKKWPQVQMPHIVYYLVEKKACDLKEMNSFRSMDSYTYLQSGWVGTVLVHEIDNSTAFLKCQVQASQSVRTVHDVWVCCKKRGEVVNSGCTCMAGRGKVCSHVGALLWKIDYAVSAGLTGESCTDRCAAWNTGTKRNMEPSSLVEINFKTQKRTIDDGPSSRKLPSVPVLLANDNELAEFYRKCPYQELVNLPGTLFHATMTAPARQPGPDIAAAPTVHHSPHINTETLPRACEPCNAFYEKYVLLSDSAVVALEAATREQNNHLWHISRRIRITASNIKRIPKREGTPTIKALQALTSPKFHGNAATQHGLQHEAVARRQLAADYKVSISACGTHVFKTRPWLSATPDGVIDTHDAIVEIKCPFLEDCMQLIHGGKYDVVVKNGDCVLSENGPNGYYPQTQFTMLCTEKSLCFFYVWSLKSAVLIKVPFSEAYIKKVMPRLEKFYFSCMLPHLEEMNRKGKLDLSLYSQLIAK